jgi:hypothetical protein
MARFLSSVHSVEGEVREEPTEERMRRSHQLLGEVLITEGPFAEGKEHLGGFYLIEAEDLDAAVAWAARVTAARFGVRRRAADQRVATRDEDRQETGRRSP